jgi:hypothetical protein
MVGPRIVSKDEDELAALHIFQRGCTLADAKRLYHRHSRRLVAHVRAIRKIVGPELPRKQLQKKSRLIRGLSRSVEAGLVGRIQTIQLVCDHLKGLGPADRLIVRRARVPYHRRSQTSLPIEPVIGFRRQVRN